MTTFNYRLYYNLTKPGIIYGNILVCAAGFLFAANEVNWLLFVSTMLGLALVIASACVFNNYYDREIDAHMARTKTRALVEGKISLTNALVFATVLGLTGGALLISCTTLPAFYAAALGWSVYVFVYTPIKHRSPHALWIGALAGATPPVVGYAAVTNTLDITAFWLFLFLFIWQVPHFLGIAAYRFEEYSAAGVPLYIKQNPSKRGKTIGRSVFYASLVILLLWCAILMLHK